MEIRAIPIHRSLHRPQSTGGCETTWFIVSLGFSGAIFFTQFTLIGLIWMIVSGSVLLMIGRWLFKNDPLAVDVFLRSRKYKKYYPPCGSVWYRAKQSK